MVALQGFEQQAVKPVNAQCSGGGRDVMPPVVPPPLVSQFQGTRDECFLMPTHACGDRVPDLTGEVARKA